MISTVSFIYFNVSTYQDSILLVSEEYRVLLLACVQNYAPVSNVSTNQDSILLMSRALSSNKNILVEGANAAMLDIDFGNYYTIEI